MATESVAPWQKWCSLHTNADNPFMSRTSFNVTVKHTCKLHKVILIIGFCILLRVILTVNNNNIFCLSKFEKLLPLNAHTCVQVCTTGSLYLGTYCKIKIEKT
jgi:hypothetical protein